MNIISRDQQLCHDRPFRSNCGYLTLMSVPPGSPEALYHAIPQTDDPVNASQIELEGETNSDPIPLPSDPPRILVDTRIRQAYFVLGCAVLLSWNGAYPYSLVPYRI